MISDIFYEGLYRPLFNLLVYFYNITGSLGLAIILITIVIRVVLYPLAKKSLKSQIAMKKIQPEVKELQEKHKDDKEKQTKEMMELYKKHGVNPFSGCLPLLIQLPILIALYRVFINGIEKVEPERLYTWVADPGKLHTMFLGVIDLAQKNIGLALIAGAVQFVQTKLTLASSLKSNPKPKKKKEGMDMAEIMNKQFLYFLPAMTVFIGISFPSALPLYWIISTLFSIGQYYVLQWEEKKQEKLEKA